jgi:protein HOOK3
LLQYYEENLGQAASTFDAVDIKAIAANADEGEIIKLTQMVLGCVVQSENNQQYIEKITTLEQSSQGVLMLMIQEVLAIS